MNGSAFLLVVVGLLLFYVVISDKFYCLQGCANCLLFGDRQDSTGPAPVGPVAPTSGTLPGIAPVNPQLVTDVRGIVGI